MSKIPKKYHKAILEAKNLGYKGAEAILNNIPPKVLAKMFVSTQDDETLNKLFKEYHDLNKTEKLKALAKECLKKKRPVPAYVLEAIQE